MNRAYQLGAAFGGVAFLVLVTYAAQVYLAAQSRGNGFHFFGPTGAQQEAFWSYALLVVAMLLGVICNFIFERTKQMTTDAIDVWAELARMVRSPKFVMALVITPLTFNSVYVAVGEIPQSVGDYLLAFQNGFFWQAILSTIARPAVGLGPADEGRGSARAGEAVG